MNGLFFGPKSSLVSCLYDSPLENRSETAQNFFSKKILGCRHALQSKHAGSRSHYSARVTEVEELRILFSRPQLFQKNCLSHLLTQAKTKIKILALMKLGHFPHNSM